MAGPGSSSARRIGHGIIAAWADAASDQHPVSAQRLLMKIGHLQYNTVPHAAAPAHGADANLITAG